MQHQVIPNNNNTEKNNNSNNMVDRYSFKSTNNTGDLDACFYRKQLNNGNTDHNQNTLPPDYVPGPRDVICQRGKECFNHSGNKRFRSCIEKNLEVYMKATSRHKKAVIVSDLISTIRDGTEPCVGFVRKDLLTRRWYKVQEKEAREKVGQAFRDAIKIRRSVSHHFPTTTRNQSKQLRTTTTTNYNNNNSKTSQEAVMLKCYQRNNTTGSICDATGIKRKYDGSQQQQQQQQQQQPLAVTTTAKRSNISSIMSSSCRDSQEIQWKNDGNVVIRTSPLIDVVTNQVADMTKNYNNVQFYDGGQANHSSPLLSSSPINPSVVTSSHSNTSSISMKTLSILHSSIQPLDNGVNRRNSSSSILCNLLDGVTRSSDVSDQYVQMSKRRRQMIPTINIKTKQEDESKNCRGNTTTKQSLSVVNPSTLLNPDETSRYLSMFDALPSSDWKSLFPEPTTTPARTIKKNEFINNNQDASEIFQAVIPNITGSSSTTNTTPTRLPTASITTSPRQSRVNSPWLSSSSSRTTKTGITCSPQSRLLNSEQSNDLDSNRGQDGNLLNQLLLDLEPRPLPEHAQSA